MDKAKWILVRYGSEWMVCVLGWNVDGMTMPFDEMQTPYWVTVARFLDYDKAKEYLKESATG